MQITCINILFSVFSGTVNRVGLLFLITLVPSAGQDAFERIDSELGTTTVVATAPPSLAAYHPPGPGETIEGPELQRIARGTLGDTLGWQAGVNASSYGQGASRPVIRGFDGFRVRILRDSVGTLDVSASSPDHGIPVEPLLLREVEILRGPAALRFGNSALGGAVNTSSRSFAVELPNRWFSGAFESRFDSVSSGLTSAGYLDVHLGEFVVTLTGSHREANEYDLAGRARTSRYQERFNPIINDPASGSTVPIPNPSGSLPNSHHDSDSHSIGVSWFPDAVPIEASLAWSNFRSDFGLPYLFGGDANDLFGFSTLALEQDRLDFRLRYLPDLPGLTEATFHFGFGDYEHSESFNGQGKDANLRFEDTLFDLQAWEARLDLAHEATEWLRGVVGFQLWSHQLSPSRLAGAPDPSSRYANHFETSNLGFFLSEIATLGEFELNAAFRWETQKIEDLSFANFGFTREVDDTSFSAILGASWEREVIGPFDRLQASLSTSFIERLPTETERFAFWTNPAIQRFLIGGDLDGTALQNEGSVGIDLGLEAEMGEIDFSLNFFHYQIDRFTYLQDITGIGNQSEYTQTDARFQGLEAQADWLLVESGDHELKLTLMGDWMRASDRRNDAPLPRIPPFRLGSRLAYTRGQLQAGLEVRHVFDQSRLQPSGGIVQGELPTDGYTEINLDSSYQFDLNDTLSLTLFARIENLLDEDRRLHTSFLKDVAPLPGRNLSLGGRLEF